jgi:hypothetical protein
VEIKVAITNWLGPIWSHQTYDDRLRRLFAETCNWILSRPEYCNWCSSEFTSNKAKFLWIHGSPGCGKTVLSARLIHYLSNDLGLHVAYFFFSLDISSLVDPFVAVRSWVAQLAFNYEDARELAESAWQYADAPKATATQVEALFCSIIQTIPYCTFLCCGWTRQGLGSV